MFKSSTEKIVKSVMDSYNFEKVSDLTKEQFTEIISQSIFQSINNSDYFKEISEQLAKDIQMSMRARGLR